jgi:Tol biopolymer transport system component
LAPGLKAILSAVRHPSRAERRVCQLQIRREKMNPRPWAQTLVVLLCLAASTRAVAGTTERVSVSSAGVPGNGDSGGVSAISADGRYVAFSSAATDLVEADTNNATDVFVFDRVTRTVERESVASDGSETQPLRDSSHPGISADGRYVVFQSLGSNLAPGDTNNAMDVFVRDRVMGLTIRVSVASDGTEGDFASQNPAISGDGRYVAFESMATNLVAGDANNVWDVFVHDLQTDQTARVSVTDAGAEANAQSYTPSLSYDGRYVAFESLANNLVDGDTNGHQDIFVRDTVGGHTARVSVATSGAEADRDSMAASISGDGRFVAFQSSATNLVTGDTNGSDDIFVHDTQTGETERVSATTDGAQANAGSANPALSSDGRFVAFQSAATNLVPDDTNGVQDIFLRDRTAGVTTLVTVAADPEQAPGDSANPAVTPYGRYVVFDSDGLNLVPGGSPGIRQVYVRDRVSFLDVPTTHWAFYYIDACVGAGIVTGYPDGTYRPDTAVDRGAMAVYVSRGLVAPAGDAAIPPGPAQATFSDVPTDHWAYKWVEYAVDQNIVAGYPDATYRPAVELNRGEMAVFVARAIVTPHGDEGLVGYTPPETPTFSDVATDHWAYKYIEYIAQDSVNVTQGYPDGTYRPAVIVTRDQMAVYVQRAFALPM